MPRLGAAIAAGLLLVGGGGAEAVAADAPSNPAGPCGDESCPAGVELLQSKFALEQPVSAPRAPDATEQPAAPEWLAELLQSVQKVSSRSPEQMRRAGVWDRCHEGVPLDACLTQAGTGAGQAVAVGLAVLAAVLLVLRAPAPGPKRGKKGGWRSPTSSVVGRAAEGLLSYASSGASDAPQRPRYAAHSPAGDAEWLWAPDLSWNMQAF